MIDLENFEHVNGCLLDSNVLIGNLLGVVNRYGTVEQINSSARKARRLISIYGKLKEIKSPYIEDLKWLEGKKAEGAFISVKDFRKFSSAQQKNSIDESNAVTLEISALQYFPWLITQAKHAIEFHELMPARYIRVRNMKESEGDRGDLLAIIAAMNVIGASYVETLDTKGTDGSNVHLGGPETITGYFGGVGQPNDYVLKWVDEYLYYYTNYGIQEVLNINPGTVLAGYILYKLGIDIKFKISVFMGNDNPYSIFWTLMTAKLFSREDGSTPLSGFNLSNSVNTDTIKLAGYIRQKLGLEDQVRIEHHITETYKSIVRQPYNRRNDLLEVVETVPNISAKHEGGETEVEEKREHPSDVLDYFRSKEEILGSGDMGFLELNYMDKHNSVNITAHELTEKGLAFKAAINLHHR